MSEESLGDLRRTHLASQLEPTLVGTTITVMGWVVSIRTHGNIVFATLRDRTGDIQVVAKKGDCIDTIRQRLATIKPHSSIGVVGKASTAHRAPGGIEIIPDTIRVFSDVYNTPPFEPSAISIKNIDTRLEVRYIDLRRSPVRHIFAARTAVLRAIRDYFAEHDYTEINTPKIISSATEGGAALFPIFYYDKEAFLAQSPQLYKEQLTMSFERVFEIAPIFRAESSRTNRHLSEAISIDMEEAFVDYNDIMNHTTELVRRAADAAKSYSNDTGNPFVVPDIHDIPRYPYGQLLDRIKDAGATIQWGDDLHPSWLRKIGLEGMYYIIDWPTGPKPFYVQRHIHDDTISESFDLMYGDLELSSGSTRIATRSQLEQNMSDKGMNVSSFGYHLGAFDYGMPPHAGCGIGLERLMMALTGTQNIRDAAFYPRDVDRLTP